MDRQVEKKTLDSTVILDSKLEKAVSFNTTLNAEEVFEQLGGPVGGWTKWHIFMFNVLCIFGVTYIGLHSPAIVFLGEFDSDFKFYFERDLPFFLQPLLPSKKTETVNNQN